MSYFINKISNAFKGLLVQNNNNYLEINESGRFNSSLHNIENFSKNKIVNISNLNNETISRKGNIIFQSEEGEIKLKSGKSNTSLFNLLNPSYDSNDDAFFSSEDNTKINNIFSDNETILNLKNNSLLIETLDTKSICLYSNNGISQISHGNLNLVSDAEILLQSSNKLNLTSLGYLIFNSERMITNIEEDLIMLSGSGEIKLGGNGITTNGLKINDNLNNNFLSLGNRDDKANRSLHIDINSNSFDNQNKNGILIESKDINNGNVFPEIELSNYDKSSSVNQTKLQSLNLGIGSDYNELNNLIFVKKQNFDNSTFIIPLDSNFKFNQNDIGSTITYTDLNIIVDTILLVDSENNRAQINNFTSVTQNNTFNSSLKQGFISRNNICYLKTKTDNDLTLGTNNDNILNINNSGNIGINTLEPLSTFEINNNYGLNINIRKDNTKKYYNPKVIQFNNSNYLIVFITENITFNIEAFMYNTSNKLVNSFTILENTTICPQFNIDNLKGINDRFLIIYSFYNGTNIVTQSSIYTSSGSNTGLGKLITHSQYLTSIYEPSIKSFEYPKSGSIIYGYVIAYLEQEQSGDRNINLKLFLNNSSGEISSINYNSLIDSFVNQDDISGGSITLREINSLKLGSLENINGILKIPLAFTGKITIQNVDSSVISRYYSLLYPFKISFNNLTNSIEFIEKTTSVSGDDILKLAESVNTGYNLFSLGFDILSINNETIISYYLQENGKNFINSANYQIFNNTNYTLGGIQKLDDSNIPIQDNKNLDFQFPTISLYHTSTISNKYFITYNVLNSESKKQIKYFENLSNTKNIVPDSFGNQIFIKRLFNLRKNYLSTIIFYNYDVGDNIFNDDSIIFKEINTETNLINFKNEQNNIKVKNSGEIDLNKQKVNNFVLSGFQSEPTSSTLGVEGEMNYFDSNLYIYLKGSWKKVTLGSI